MRNITFSGGHEGMRKIPFFLLLHDDAWLSQEAAHAATTRVLHEEEVTLEVPDELAARLVAQAEALGVTCR